MTTLPKDQLRQLARKTLAKIPPDERKIREARLLQNLVDSLKSHYPGAFRIGIYSALSHEVDLSLLHPMMSERQFHYPLVTSDHEMSFHLVSNPETLVSGRYRIPEPVPLKHPPVEPGRLDLILVPGLAFDVRGNRLGHGAGYYDRYLSQIPLTPRIGISLASQHLPAIAAEAHDQSVNLLISDRGRTLC